MRGRWTLLGPRPFPLDGAIPCQLYRWIGPAELDRVEVPFYCPLNEYPRRFFSGPVLEYWRDAEGGAKSLDELCRIRIRVLSRFEQALQLSEASTTEMGDGPVRVPAPPVEAYEFYLALFRNRLLGRAPLKRRLRCHKDFIDLRERSGPGKLLISPTALGVVDRRQPSRG